MTGNVFFVTRKLKGYMITIHAFVLTKFGHAYANYQPTQGGQKIW